jgi:hypothetical protein
MSSTDNDDFTTSNPSQYSRPLPFACTDGPTTPLMPSEPTTLQTLAGVMGNVLEWYDFALFGFFSDVIAEVFFAPSGGQEVKDDDLGFGGEIGVDGADTGNLIKSFLVYGIGELCFLSDIVSTTTH